MTVSREYIERITGHLEKIGASDIRLTWRSKHLRIAFVFEGAPYWRMLPASPSTVHGFRPIISEINHMLGLVGGKRTGARTSRQRQRPHQRRAECPRLTALPDWRDALRRLA